MWVSLAFTPLHLVFCGRQALHTHYSDAINVANTVIFMAFPIKLRVSTGACVSGTKGGLTPLLAQVRSLVENQ